MEEYSWNNVRDDALCKNFKKEHLSGITGKIPLNLKDSDLGLLMIKAILSIFLVTSTMASTNDVEKIISSNSLLMNDFKYVRSLNIKKKIKIAVIGDYVHPEEFESIRANLDEVENNGIDDDGNGYIDDFYGYDLNSRNGKLRTPVVGGHENGIVSIMDAIISEYNLIGKVEIIPVNIYSFDGKFDEFRFKKLADSIDYALARGAKIISISQGVSLYNKYSFRFIDNDYEKSLNYVQAAVERARKKGAIIVGSISNDNSRDHVKEPSVPGNLENVLSVANVDAHGVIQSGYGKNVEIAYYGTDIFVWEGRCEEFIKGFKGECTELKKTNGFKSVTGSSLSTPIVALSLGILSATGVEIQMNDDFKNRLHNSCSRSIKANRSVKSKCIFSPSKLTAKYLK